MKKLVILGMALFIFSAPVLAETVYVKERQTVSLRSGMTAEAEVVGRAVTGTGLELLEQNETHTRVRAADGTEGWVINGLLTRDKPAALKILAAETRMKKAQADAASLAKQVKQLESRLKAQAAEQNKPPVEEPEPAEPAMPATFKLDLLWIGISFAMLIAGFAAGALWLRERTRRKLGGMHIRVS